MKIFTNLLWNLGCLSYLLVLFILYTTEGRCEHGFLCFSGTCLSPSLQQDGISDCPGLSQEDEQDGSTGNGSWEQTLEYVV